MSFLTPSGVLVVDKARGPTSHDVVARVRRALRIREIGHAGTLDPMATGVLVLALGEATKLVPWLTAHDKAYETEIALGVQTDTLDAEGREVIRATLGTGLLEALSQPCDRESSPLLNAALEAERMRTTQVPPAYSAIRTQGERAFVAARRGAIPVLAPRPVHVARLDLLAWGSDPAFLSLAVEVGKGYYVRALARDLATALGTVGHVTRLRRLRSGPFVIDEAVAVDAPPDHLRARIQPIAAAAGRALALGKLTEAGTCDARHGRPVRPYDIDAPLPGPCAWLDPGGGLVAVGEVDEAGRGRVLRGFSCS
jgi:tRNA pseudouridine55 synthase